MVRALVEKLPIMTTPSWVRSRAQPIAIEDVIDYLMEALDYTPHGSEIFEIGGADAISYEGIMREYAKIRGLKRLIIPIPFLTPGLSSHWLALVTPLYARVGRQLIEGVRNDTLVTDRRAVEVFSVKPRGIGEAIQRALDNEDREFAETRWTDAQLPDDRRNKWGGRRFGSRLMYTESISVPVKPEEAFLPIQYIGGETGWYSYPWLWSLRGFIDKLSGGVGGNRGRRDPLVLLPGDVVDFWRVEELIQYRMLRLKAEMKVPGRGWLQFDVESAGENQSVIRVTALFEPLGLLGLREDRHKRRRERPLPEQPAEQVRYLEGYREYARRPVGAQRRDRDRPHQPQHARDHRDARYQLGRTEKVRLLVPQPVVHCPDYAVTRPPPKALPVTSLEHPPNRTDPTLDEQRWRSRPFHVQCTFAK